MTYDQFCAEVIKLKKRATKINKSSPNVMVVIGTRIKPRKK